MARQPKATKPAPAAAAVLAPEMTPGAARYPVLSPLRFDGRSYRPTDPEANEVTMTPEQADPLIIITVLGPRLG